MASQGQLHLATRQVLLAALKLGHQLDLLAAQVTDLLPALSQVRNAVLTTLERSY
jgi:hypothetical protein